MNKKEILNKVDKLIKMYKDGKLGGAGKKGKG